VSSGDARTDIDQQKMNQLRLEADEATTKVEELQAKIKTLEQESLSKEQEITSLQHKNNVLEGQVEKLEADVDKYKKVADEGSGSMTQNETLQRRLQLLEEEAEVADKTLREANEKYGRLPPRATPPRYFALSMVWGFPVANLKSSPLFPRFTGFDRPTLRPDTSSARFKPSSRSATSGRPSMRKCPRSTTRPRRSWRSSSVR
jgi:hypothetical protein